MAQVSGTRPGKDEAPAHGRRRRGLELAGLVFGILAGLGIALAWLVPARSHPSGPAPLSTHAPVTVRGSSAQPDPAALDAEWAAYSDRSSCADWAGGDGVSAIRLNSSQLAWFYSDTYIGPAGPTIGFSHLSGFVHNSVVTQTTTGPDSTFVTMTGGGACTGPGRPGNATPVVGPPPKVPGGSSDRYWDEDGLRVGGTVIKFYDHYLPGGVPYVPLGTVIAAFGVSQLSSAGRGPQYGAVARPTLVPLPSYTPPGGGSPVLWGAALLAAGNTVYVYGTQSPNVSAPSSQLYLARVPVSQLASFPAWRFYAGAGRWAAGQRQARPVQPPGSSLAVSSGFSVIAAGGRYWLIQAGTVAGSPDIDAYPAAAPWGPFDPAAGRLLYRDPSIGLDAAHDYRIMYEARAEPALSSRQRVVISYNVNSEAVTTGCSPMSAFTNTVTMPRFVAVPLAAFGAVGTLAAKTSSGPADLPRIVQQDPSQWFDAWAYRGGCPPVPGLASVQARPGAAKVTLSWRGVGLSIRYLVYLRGPDEPGDSPVTTTYADAATITGLRSGEYHATVVPVNAKKHTGTAADVTFAVSPSG